MFTFTCPACGRTHWVRDRWAGRWWLCPRTKGSVVVPEKGRREETPAAPPRPRPPRELPPPPPVVEVLPPPEPVIIESPSAPPEPIVAIEPPPSPPEPVVVDEPPAAPPEPVAVEPPPPSPVPSLVELPAQPPDTVAPSRPLADELEAPPPPEERPQTRPFAWGRVLLVLAVVPPLMFLGKLGYDRWKRHRSASQETSSRPAESERPSTDPHRPAMPTPAATPTPETRGTVAIAHATFTSEDFQEFRALLGDVLQEKKPSSQGGSVGGLILGGLVVCVYDESQVHLPDLSANTSLNAEAKERIRASLDPYFGCLRLVRNNGLGEPERVEAIDLAPLEGEGSGSVMRHRAAEGGTDSWDIQAVARTGRWVAYAACRASNPSDAGTLLPAAEAVVKKVLAKMREEPGR